MCARLLSVQPTTIPGGRRVIYLQQIESVENVKEDNGNVDDDWVAAR